MQASLSCKYYSPQLSRIIGSWAVTLLLAAFLLVVTTVGCGSAEDPEPTMPTEPLKIIDSEELPS